MATADRMSAIEHWMLSVSRDGGAERFDDLHVESIDSDWKSKGAWIDGGVWAFQEAIQLRDRLDLPFTVALGFSLCAGKVCLER